MQEVKIVKNKAGYIVLLIDDKPIGPLTEITLHVGTNGKVDATVRFPDVKVNLEQRVDI